ncbi:uncharacterized protein LOC113684595, partial [Pocillopora damicornis]|uniref:uncharacterized protein LOC113684595 n=1 Tax=Pocillopora damicornis TaxID=46731 RepID=UPI000F558279
VHSFSLIVGSRDNHQLTRPERVDGRREKQDLSTSEKGGHVDDASYRLTAFDKDWTLDVKRNKELIPSSFAVRTFENDGSEVIQEGNYDHCHYQGTIRGLNDSRVVLNTCSGLRGLIDDGHETFYIIPETGHEENGTHRVSKAEEDESQDIFHNCGNDEIQADSHFLNETSGPVARKRRSISGHIDDFYKKYLTTDETRYTEIFICVDNEIYRKYNRDKNVIKDRVITLVNAVDAIYQRINIRIVLKYLEIWTNGDPFGRGRNSGTELNNFRAYRNKNLVKRFPHDNALLLSHRSWDKHIVGLAWVNAMCGGNSNSINAWSYSSIIGPYVTVAHEMGHNFAFNHDTGNCKCLTPRGCFMGGHKTRLPGFSDCSLKSLQKINDACLYNVPTYKAYNSYCGNGIREKGEECDCGTPEMCQAKDPCCEPHNCVLKKESQCSDLHHSCCKNCLFKKQGTLCRGVKTDCDVPEYCTGASRDCPEDTYIINGYPCSQAKTVIQGNTNFYSVVTRDLNPMVNARYLRINPQYWHGWPCMRTDFMGCSAHEVSPTTPTPLKSNNFDLCLAPSSKSCSPRDNELIIFVSGSRCSERHFQFTRGKDGLLRHACSGKLVCPENGGTHNGAKIVVSRTCKVADSKFIRTAGRSLKHVKSGKCVHPTGYWPGNGRHLVIWSGCDQHRLQLWFGKQDCVEPLGMQNGEIKDRQITATSYRAQDFAHYARLKGKKYWCAKANNKAEYIQVDLGKVKTISKILMQGRGNWYDWVTGFFLHYSYDGQRWKTYAESGDDQQSDSFCYLGKCSETPNTQCKDLWGATATSADQGCYDKLNTEARGYGTCDPTTKRRCASRDVLCGQLQCEADDSIKKPVVDYGRARDKKIILPSGKKCNAVELKGGDSVGLGMVRDGTKCGPHKMCVNYKCQSLSYLNVVGKCPVVGNKECAGRGVCTNKKVCHCQGGFDPKDGCKSELSPRNGAWGRWSSWTKCDKGCDGGKRRRHRYCDNPLPLHGGADCAGQRLQTKDCNTQRCPRVISCRHLQRIAREKNHFYPDGVYKIYPTGSRPVMTYCDMTRDGGGWTLLVTSHTNSWKAQNVKLRNANYPKLTDDFSILQYADSIKNNKDVTGTTFEYRLEAQSRGRWGGIWKAPRDYTFTATNNKQTKVELIKKFDNWKYSNGGIEQRMPWISGARLTTSGHAQHYWWGSITGDDKSYHPAPWISGDRMESQPSYIWYWMREGPLKGSISVSDCQDGNRNCKYWASHGHCKKSANYMSKNCRKSCNLCQDCQDGNKNCKYWASHGHCKKSANYMSKNCRKSCNLCQAGEIRSFGDFFVNPFPWRSQIAPGFIYGTQILDRIVRMATRIASIGHRMVIAKSLRTTCLRTAVRVATFVKRKEEKDKEAKKEIVRMATRIASIGHRMVIAKSLLITCLRTAVRVATFVKGKEEKDREAKKEIVRMATRIASIGHRMVIAKSLLITCLRTAVRVATFVK